MALTGICDVDTGILLYVPDCSLPYICRCNKYLRQVCDSDRHWQLRISLRFSRRWDEIPFLMAKEYYIFLSRDNTPEIEKALNLSPEENYIRVKTRDGDIMPGSEKYRSIEVLLPRAFKRQDRRLIDYFIDVYRKVVDLTKEDSYSLSPSVDDALASAVDYVASGGDEELLIRVLDIYSQTGMSKLTSTCRAIGRHNLTKYLAHINETIDAYYPQDHDTEYMIGLIEGNHYDVFIGEIPSRGSDDIMDIGLGSVSVLVDPKTDPRFLDWFLENYPEDPRDFLSKIGECSLSIGRLDLGMEFEEWMEPMSIYRALLKSDPQLAEIYRSENGISKVAPAITHFTTFIQDIREGRERDAVKLVPYLETNSLTFLIGALSRYRDIVVYLISTMSRRVFGHDRNNIVFAITGLGPQWHNLISITQSLDPSEFSTINYSHALEI